MDEKELIHKVKNFAAEKLILVVKDLPKNVLLIDIGWTLTVRFSPLKVLEVIPISDEYSYVILSDSFEVECAFSPLHCIINDNKFFRYIHDSRNVYNNSQKPIELIRYKEFNRITSAIKIQRWYRHYYCKKVKAQIVISHWWKNIYYRPGRSHYQKTMNKIQTGFYQTVK